MEEKSSCGCMIFILLFNLLIGTWSSIEILSWFHKSIPLIGNVIIGLFAGEISVPVAVIGYILRLFGVFKKLKIREDSLMKEKTLDISEEKSAKKNISDLKVYGNTDTFLLLCKASSQEEGFMKSTKVCNVQSGCIVQVSTQQKNPDGSYSVAEALTYVPNMMIDTRTNPRRLVPITGEFCQ